MDDQGICVFRAESFVFGLRGQLTVTVEAGPALANSAAQGKCGPSQSSRVTDDGSLKSAAVRDRLEIAAAILGVKLHLTGLSGCDESKLLGALLDGIVSALSRIGRTTSAKSAEGSGEASGGKASVLIYREGKKGGLQYIFTPNPNQLKVSFDFPPPPLTMAQWDGPLGAPNEGQRAGIVGQVNRRKGPALAFHDSASWIEGPTRALRGASVVVRIEKVPVNVPTLDEPIYRAFLAALRNYLLGA